LVVGKYVSLQDAYKSITESLIHASAYNNRKLDLKLISSDDISPDNIVETLEGLQGIIIAPGFGNRGIEGKITAIQYARENNIPCLGICMGMQCMVIEYARNVIGYKDANSTEIDPNTKHNVVDLMEEQKGILNLGGSMRLGAYKCKIDKNSLAYKVYNAETIKERHRHRFEFNNDYKEKFIKAD
jgi:CTP synthase